MSNKIKDTDYLYLSTKIRAMESRLLGEERMERMLEATTNEDAAKVLVECGYPEMPVVTVDTVDEVLAKARESLFAEMSDLAPVEAMLDVFKVKYDYHNAKALLKSEALGLDPSRLLMDTGRVAPKVLEEAVKKSEFRDIPAVLTAAIIQAREVLGTTKDPQRSDLLLDKAYFQEMKQLAQATNSDFLKGYVRMLVDAANLRSVVRVLRMGRGADYLETVLFPGGNVSEDRVLKAANGEALETVYFATRFEAASAAGQYAIHGGSLTGFEKACDNAVNAYMQQAKYVSFGEQPMLGYVSAKDNEFTAVRIILTGRLADLPADVIRERLRNAYV